MFCHGTLRWCLNKVFKTDLGISERKAGSPKEKCSMFRDLKQEQQRGLWVVGA